MPSDIDARLFWRVALQRFEDGQTLLGVGRANAAIYLAGYSVECALKALLICHTPAGDRKELLLSFRGAKWHKSGFILEQLKVKGVSPPVTLVRDLLLVGGWSTDLRYEIGLGSLDDAQRFIDAIQSILAWASGKIN